MLPSGSELRVLQAELADLHRKIIVLDDDPTGTQCANSVFVYFTWDHASMRRLFLDGKRVSFIMTNSRSLAQEKTRELHRELAETIWDVSQELGVSFFLVSRSDSTLRWNYPVETDELRAVLCEHHLTPDAELICPCLLEAGRVTEHGVHYVLADGEMIPVAQTEFARDETFHFEHSDLSEYIIEKYQGNYDRSLIRRLDIDLLSGADQGAIDAVVRGVRNADKLIIDATDYASLSKAVLACIRALKRGRHFIYRGAASFLRLLMEVPFAPLVDPFGLSKDLGTGGLIVAGSHVETTNRQLARLAEGDLVSIVELNQHLVIDPELFAGEIESTAKRVSDLLAAGRSVCLQTRRERFDVPRGSERQQLGLTNRIARGLVDVVSDLTCEPRYLIAKGGITSHDVGRMICGGSRGYVVGQVIPGVSVWRTGPEAVLPGTAYLVFPGNVGGEDDLFHVVSDLEKRHGNH